MTDAIFFLKSSVPSLPQGIKGIALDPVQMGFSCGGIDPYCSTAYSNMWQALGGNSGIIPNLRKKFGINGRIAFVSFSAGHGFLNPLLTNDSDRANTSAVILLDSTFGEGKTGFIDAVKDAASGKLLLVSTTSDKGTTDPLTNGDYAWRQFVINPSGISLPSISPASLMPVPDEGTFGTGNIYYYRYSHSELPHISIVKLLNPVIKSYLIPYWSGTTISKKRVKIGLLIAIGAVILGATYLLRKT